MDAELLHYIGEAPEGPWAIFTEPGGSGWRLISVIVPRSFWMALTRRDPFSSDIQLMERLGRQAIHARRAEDGTLPSTIWVTPDLVQETFSEYGELWATLSRCGQCGDTVPSGEVAEGLKNALPPTTRGDTEVLVLCPRCLVQSRFQLTPLGARAL